MVVEPTRLVPSIGALHAFAAAPRRRAAAICHAEAARATSTGVLSRAGHVLAAQVEFTVAAAAASLPLRALDACAGTTQCAPPPVDLAARRGHRADAGPIRFGLLGAVGGTVVYALGEAAACVAGVVHLDAAARRATRAVGWAVLSYGCSVSAAVALLPKFAVLAAAAAFGAALGLGRALFAPTGQAPASFHPALAEVATFEAQRRLEAHLAGRPVAEADARVNTAVDLLEARASGPSWPTVWLQADGRKALATPAARAAALAQACAAPDGTGRTAGGATERPVWRRGGVDDGGLTGRRGRWAAQVEAVSAPSALAQALGAVQLRVGERTLELADLVAAGPALSTCFVAHGGAFGRPAVRVDAVFDWPAGSVVPMGNFAPQILSERLGLVLSVDVEAPASAEPASPIACVRQLVLGVGEAAAAAVRPLRVRP